jgi:hypothetical protein
MPMGRGRSLSWKTRHDTGTVPSSIPPINWNLAAPVAPSVVPLPDASLNDTTADTTASATDSTTNAAGSAVAPSDDGAASVARLPPHCVDCSATPSGPPPGFLSNPPSVAPSPSLAPSGADSASSTVPSTSLSADTSAPPTTTSTNTTVYSGDSSEPSAKHPANQAVPTPQDNDAANGADPSMHKRAVKIPKQHSKTAVGRLTYGITQIPSLYVLKASIDTNTGTITPPVWEPVKSQRLRQLAVNKWLAHGDNNDIRRLISVDVRENKGTVFIVAGVVGAEHRKNVKSRLCPTPWAVANLAKKVTVNGERIDQAIQCRQIEDEFPADSVEGSFKRNLRNLPGGKESSFSIPLKDISAEFDPLLQSCTRVSPTTPYGYTLNVRCQPNVGDEQQALHFDFDFMPCFPNKHVHEVILDLVGQNSVATPDLDVVSKNLPDILRHLRGLTVRCAYVPGARAKAELLSGVATLRGSEFQIKDIRMHADIDRFTKNGTRYAIYEYFKKGKYLFVSVRNERG